ncbi:MAG TPA: glycosyltransferase 87 family protein, partial [Bauldia sp.]|nr:glycosyltransferase 87 family protein [Bauldia sp.]
MTLPDAIRSGRWLTPERLRAYPAIVAILAAVVLAGLVATSEGLVRADGQPVGTDFSNVYAAGRLVLDGRPAAPYDPALQHAAERAVFGGRDVAFYGWHYPPMALLPAAALALLPYGLALVAWMAATLALYLGVVRAIVPRPETLVVALGFPAVFVNLGHGQNGFLTAALLGGALL